MSPDESEDRLIGWLRRRLRRAGTDLLGDDAATLEARGEWAVTVDQQIEGTHFPPGLDPALVGRRLVRINLSDLAAMGAVPRFAFLALALPSGAPARSALDGVLRECGRWGLTLAGGDVARGPRLAASLTLLGARTPGGRWLRRGAARPGDAIWVGGSLGEAALGRRLLELGARPEGRAVRLPESPPLGARAGAAARRAVRRQLLPRPQLELGAWLARRRRAAAIDVSDGLAIDLHRLCRESGVGACIHAAKLPFPEALRGVAERLGEAPLELQLGGGEDYVLLFTLSPRVAPPPELGCRRIGRVTGRAAVEVEAGGRRRPLATAGWDHLRDPG